MGRRAVLATYHGLVGELLDLLDGLGGALLEGLAVELCKAATSAIRPAISLHEHPSQTNRPASISAAKVLLSSLVVHGRPPSRGGRSRGVVSGCY
jgi:hypothetical protein